MTPTSSTAVVMATSRRRTPDGGGGGEDGQQQQQQKQQAGRSRCPEKAESGVASCGSRSSCYTTSSATMTAGDDSGDAAPEEGDFDEAFGSTWQGGGGGISRQAKLVLKGLKIGIKVTHSTVCTHFEGNVV